MSVVQLGLPESFDPTNDKQLASLVRSITRAIEARMTAGPRPQLERMVYEKLLEFQDARVTQYIPLLVEKAVLMRLRAQPIQDRGIAK